MNSKPAKHRTITQYEQTIEMTPRERQLRRLGVKNPRVLVAVRPHETRHRGSTPHCDPRLTGPKTLCRSLQTAAMESLRREIVTSFPQGASLIVAMLLFSCKSSKIELP